MTQEEEDAIVELRAVLETLMLLPVSVKTRKVRQLIREAIKCMEGEE